MVSDYLLLADGALAEVVGFVFLAPPGCPESGLVLLHLFSEIGSHNMRQTVHIPGVDKLLAEDFSLCRKILFVPDEDAQYRNAQVSGLPNLCCRILHGKFSHIGDGIFCSRAMKPNGVWPAVRQDNQDFLFLAAVFEFIDHGPNGKTIPFFPEGTELQNVAIALLCIVILAKAVDNGVIPVRAKTADPVGNSCIAERLVDEICLRGNLWLATG